MLLTGEKMKKILTLIFSFLIIIGNILASTAIEDTLEVGQTKTYSIDGKVYSITPMVVASEGENAVTKFIVNDQVTISLSENEKYVLNDGRVLKIKNIHPTISGDIVQNLVEFSIEGETKPVQKCYDSDNGINYYTQGTIKYNLQHDEKYQYSYSDTCSGSTLNEMYCDSQGNAQTTYYTCPNGCKNGACIKTPSTVVSGVVSIVAPTAVIASQGDLRDYPYMFISNGIFDGYIVVGDNAPASDVVAATDIMNSLNTKLYASVTADETLAKENVVRLASEISDPFNQNLISVGNACDNKITKKLLGIDFEKEEMKVSNEDIWVQQGIPERVSDDNSCTVGLREGLGKIELYVYNGKKQIVVYGNSAEDTRKAAYVLANWNKYKLSGSAVCVSGTKDNPSIVSCTDKLTSPTFVRGDDSDREIYPPKAKEVPIGEIMQVPTCNDGVRNDGEEGVDCGGPCEPCKEKTIECNSGCITDGKCLPFGTRIVGDNKNALYCDISGKFSEQKGEGAICQNNYECLSNTCSNGVCVDINKQLQESRGILEKILSWFSRLFGGR